MNAKHTPAPWPVLILEPYPEGGVTLSGHDYVYARDCVNAIGVIGGDPATVKDLRAALEATLGWLTSFSMPPTSTTKEKDAACARLRAALAKVKGE